MNPKSLRRECCVVCGADELESIVTIASFPVFQGCVDFDMEAGECAPMRWVACERCGSAQVADLPPLNRIYQAGHATGLGTSWARHHAAFAAFLDAHVAGPVTDIGGGSGTLAAAYRKTGGKAPWTILEPNALRTANLPPDIDIVEGFLEGTVLRRLGTASVVMCHMLEHVVDLRAALREISDSLPPHGTVLLAWPGLETWTRSGVAGALNFEHGLYVTVPRLETLFEEFGWRKSAEQHFGENDTVFLAFIRGIVTKQNSVAHISAAPAIARYFSVFREHATAITRALDTHSGEAFLMPASVYAQALIAGGLDQDRFAALLDNAPIKQGRRLYGTKLRVAAPATALADTRAPLVVLNGGAHEPEIAGQLRAIRSDVRILNGRGEPLDSAEALARADRQKLPPARSALRLQNSTP